MVHIEPFSASHVLITYKGHTLQKLQAEGLRFDARSQQTSALLENLNCLSPFNPDRNSRAWFREAQMKGLDLSSASVVNTVDLGDAKDIHPKDKEPICKRLALLAREDVYGETVNGKGPIHRGHAIEGNKIIITFDHVEELKTTDGAAPKGFWIADANGEWSPASATIHAITVALQADAVDAPKACRYAWLGKPDVNLVDEDGLPAYPFRTDDW